MSLLDAINPISGIVNAITSVITRVFPDATTVQTEKLSADLQEELAKMDIIKTAMALDQKQADVNQAEAGNPSLYVSGWRPTIGWVCAISLGLYYIPTMVVASFAWIHDMYIAGHYLVFPMKATITDLLALTGNLLGMATLRTVEKLNDAD